MNGQQQMLIELGKAMGWKHDNRTLDACFTRPDENFSRFFNPLKHPAHRDELVDFMGAKNYHWQIAGGVESVPSVNFECVVTGRTFYVREPTVGEALTHAACLALGIEWRE